MADFVFSYPSTQTGKVDFIRVSSFSHHAEFTLSDTLEPGTQTGSMQRKARLYIFLGWSLPWLRHFPSSSLSFHQERMLGSFTTLTIPGTTAAELLMRMFSSSEGLCLRFTVLSSSCPACWSVLPPPS